MTSARAAGGNPVKAWQDTEKALEIDATLARLAQAGIEAYYHCCNCSDRAAVTATLAKVRAVSGPIRGVLHGAGVGKDSRFDRKQPDKVEQCIAAKVDGALALMDATEHDPLECFIGFGSISGRFGANGHTDYSLANDMLCKTIDWFAGSRPEVKAIGFHWHAWGDVGMATKPETRLALEMIDMQFMPAEEGFQHLINEIEGGAGESEVLITDDRYYRMFYPAETLLAGESPESTENLPSTPLLQRAAGNARATAPATSASSTIACHTYNSALNPAKDPFLADHLLDGRPLLPFVIAAEMLLEAGRDALRCRDVELHNIEAVAGLKFFHDAPQEVRVEVRHIDNTRAHCRLLSDFVARDGRIVDPNRLNFSAEVIAAQPLQTSQFTNPALTRIALPDTIKRQTAVYPTSGAKFFVGWPLQRLKKVALVPGGLVGDISAPALIELAGSGRDVCGWRIPSAALDACLFAVGILAWQQIAPGAALPVRMGQLRLGRLPTPGEACQIHARVTHSAASQSTASNPASSGRATFNFTLYGVDEQPLVDVVDYEIAWLSTPANDAHSIQSTVSKPLSTHGSPQLQSREPS